MFSQAASKIYCTCLRPSSSLAMSFCRTRLFSCMRSNYTVIIQPLSCLKTLSKRQTFSSLSTIWNRHSFCSLSADVKRQNLSSLSANVKRQQFCCVPSCARTQEFSGLACDLKQLADPTGLVWSRLKNRALLRISGKDSIGFLQGLVTNDMKYLNVSSVNHGALYAFLLNTQGRVMHDLIIYNCPIADSDVPNLIIECDSNAYEDLAKTLLRYRMRKKVEMTNCTDTLAVYSIFRQAYRVPNSELVKLDEGPNFLPSVWQHRTFHDPIAWCPDPRVPFFGARIILSSHEAETLGVYVTGGTEYPESAYRECRYSLGIAEGIEEILPGKSFPLESNGDYLNGVSFHKGCYIGQELTARTHHTGVVRKRIMPVQLETSASGGEVPRESKIVNEQGALIGRLRITQGRRGLALLRVAEAIKASKLLVEIEKDEQIVDKVPCETWKPHWWAHSELAGEIKGPTLKNANQ